MILFSPTPTTQLPSLLSTKIRPKQSPLEVPGEENPQVCDASVLLPREVFGAVYQSKQASVVELLPKRSPQHLSCLCLYTVEFQLVSTCLDSYYCFKPFSWMTLKFRSLMCGNHSASSILQFWNHLKTLDGFKHHHILHSLEENDLVKCIPCCIHGDGAEMFRDDEFWVMNWSSAFASSGGHDCLVSRYPILLVAERQMQNDMDFCQ